MVKNINEKVRNYITEITKIILTNQGDLNNLSVIKKFSKVNIKIEIDCSELVADKILRTIDFIQMIISDKDIHDIIKDVIGNLHNINDINYNKEIVFEYLNNHYLNFNKPIEKIKVTIIERLFNNLLKISPQTKGKEDLEKKSLIPIFVFTYRYNSMFEDEDKEETLYDYIKTILTDDEINLLLDMSITNNKIEFDEIEKNKILNLIYDYKLDIKSYDIKYTVEYLLSFAYYVEAKHNKIYSKDQVDRLYLKAQKDLELAIKSFDKKFNGVKPLRELILNNISNSDLQYIQDEIFDDYILYENKELIKTEFIDNINNSYIPVGENSDLINNVICTFVNIVNKNSDYDIFLEDIDCFVRSELKYLQNKNNIEEKISLSDYINSIVSGDLPNMIKQILILSDIDEKKYDTMEKHVLGIISSYVFNADKQDICKEINTDEKSVPINELLDFMREINTSFEKRFLNKKEDEGISVSEILEKWKKGIKSDSENSDIILPNSGIAIPREIAFEVVKEVYKDNEKNKVIMDIIEHDDENFKPLDKNTEDTIELTLPVNDYDLTKTFKDINHDNVSSFTNLKISEIKFRPLPNIDNNIEEEQPNYTLVKDINIKIDIATQTFKYNFRYNRTVNGQEEEYLVDKLYGDIDLKTGKLNIAAINGKILSIKINKPYYTIINDTKISELYKGIINYSQLVDFEFPKPFKIDFNTDEALYYPIEYEIVEKTEQLGNPKLITHVNDMWDDIYQYIYYMKELLNSRYDYKTMSYCRKLINNLKDKMKEPYVIDSYINMFLTFLHNSYLPSVEKELNLNLRPLNHILISYEIAIFIILKHEIKELNLDIDLDIILNKFISLEDLTMFIICNFK